MLRPLAIATQSPTKATNKAVGLKSTLTSILPEQKPESVTRRVMRIAETEKRPKLGYVPAPGGDIVSRLKKGDEQLKRAQEVESAKRGAAVAPSIQERLTRKAEMVTQESTQIRLGEVARWAENNPLTFDSIFGEVSVVMTPEIAERYRSGDPGTKLEIVKMYHDQAVEEATKFGRKVVPRWKDSQAAKAYELGKILADTEVGRMTAQLGKPTREMLDIKEPNTDFDQRFDYQPTYIDRPEQRFISETLGIGEVIFDQLDKNKQNYSAFLWLRENRPDLFEGTSNVLRGAARRTEDVLPVNPLLNFPAQFYESAADLIEPGASLGKTALGAVGVGGALFPYAKGIGTASAMLKAGSKYGPALEAGLNAATREGIIGWSMLERNVRARDLANILEGTGAFASKAEKADFIKQIQRDAKEWASKNSKDSNEFLAQEEEFYKNLIRQSLDQTPAPPVVGVPPGATRAANAFSETPFQPAVGQTLAPVTDTRRVATLAGELAILEGDRYQQLIPEFKLLETTDDDIENSVMDSFVQMVNRGVPQEEATQIAAQAAKFVQRSNNNVDANQWLKDNDIVVSMTASRFNKNGEGSFYYTFKDRKTKKTLTQVRVSDHALTDSGRNHPDGWAMDTSVDPDNYDLDLEAEEFAANRIAAIQGKPLPFPNYDKEARVFDEFDIDSETFQHRGREQGQLPKNVRADINERKAKREVMIDRAEAESYIVDTKYSPDSSTRPLTTISSRQDSVNLVPDKTFTIGNTGWVIRELDDNSFKLVNERTGESILYGLRGSRKENPWQKEMMQEMLDKAVARAKENPTNPLSEAEILARRNEYIAGDFGSTKQYAKNKIPVGTVVKGTLEDGTTVTGKLGITYDKFNIPKSYRVGGKKVKTSGFGRNLNPEIEPVGGFEGLPVREFTREELNPNFYKGADIQAPTPPITPKITKFLDANESRIKELESVLKSQKRSLGKNRQRGAYIPPTKEEIELLARTALDTVYRTGEKVVDTVKNMVRYLDLQEEDVNKIYDSIRGLDQDAGKEIPTTQAKATVPPTDLPDLVATANRITEEVRKSVGLDGATKATPEQIADWTEEARKINTSKLMNDMMSGTGNLRPLSKAEELAVGARLSRALERYSSALDELRATDTPSSELLDRIESARNEIDEISKFSLAVGTEWGKAGVARQALIRADYTTAGVITRFRKKEKLVSKDSSMAVQATKQEMADAEEFARISREKDDKIAALEKKIEDLKAQGAKEAPKRRQELRRQKLESERDDILSQIMGIRSGEKKVPQPKMTGESGAINIADDVELFELYGKLAKNAIQRGALTIEDVYVYVSEVAKQAGHTLTKQGMIDALDAQMLRGRRKDAKRATKAELRARQRLYREVERGATRNVAEREREIAAREVTRKAREEAIQIKKQEIAAKREAIRAERDAQKATSKAEADAYRAAAKKAREEARALAKKLKEADDKAKLDARQARRAELNEALGPIARDERKIANLKGKIEDYNRMLETGEFFASRALKEGDEGYELTHLQTQLEQLRYEAKVAKQNVDTIIDDLGQPAWKKVFKEVIELPRYMQLGLDAGALTRQGFDIALVSPTAWTKAAKRGFGAAISNPAKVARLEEEFMRDPDVLKAIANGLAIDGPSDMPEGFISKAAQKIPLYGRGERFHKTFQNFARYETYRNLTRGQNMNQYQLKETAKLINAMTGRGGWKGAEGKLASIYTAPKMYAGQLEVMAKTATAIVDPRFWNNPAYKKLIVRRWLGRMGGIVALKALADATDWEFSINPDDSDFLKLRNGNTVIDVTGGYSSWYKLLFATLNDVYEQGMSEPFVERLQRSLGYKISPTYRTPISLITGKDAIGKPFFTNPDTGEREMNVQDLAKTFAPLIGMQIYEMAGGDEGYADMDNGAKVALGGLGLIGTGVSNYAPRESSRKPEDTKWGQFLESVGVQPR